MMKLGQLVVYHLGDTEDLGGNHNPSLGGHGRTAAAVVVNVGDLVQEKQTWVNLKVLTDAKDDVWKTSVKIGDGPGQVSEG